jgi:hypothetical protein
MNIRTLYDDLGNVSGYWDDDKNCWCPPPPITPELVVVDNVDLTTLTKDELKRLLIQRNIEFSPKDNKDDLIRRFGPVE